MKGEVYIYSPLVQSNNLHELLHWVSNIGGLTVVKTVEMSVEQQALLLRLKAVNPLIKIREQSLLNYVESDSLLVTNDAYSRSCLVKFEVVCIVGSSRFLYEAHHHSNDNTFRVRSIDEAEYLFAMDFNQRNLRRQFEQSLCRSMRDLCRLESYKAFKAITEKYTKHLILLYTRQIVSSISLFRKLYQYRRKYQQHLKSKALLGWRVLTLYRSTNRQQCYILTCTILDQKRTNLLSKVFLGWKVLLLR